MFFYEKAAKKKTNSDVKYVKYINSLKSEKTKQWRFNERMIALEGGESLDAALKRMEEKKKLLNIELPDPSQITVDSKNETSDSIAESTTETEIEESSIPEPRETSSENKKSVSDVAVEKKDSNQEEETSSNEIDESEPNDSNEIETESDTTAEAKPEESKEKE